MKLNLAVPCYDKWEAEFGNSLALSMTMLSQTGLLESMRLTYVKGTLIQEARAILANDAIEADADFIVYLDCDMGFEPATLMTLLQRDKDEYPIIGIDAWMRVPPYAKTAKYWSNERALEQARIGGRRPRTTGVEEVRAVGFGITRINVDIIKQMDKPWFDMPWSEKEQRFDGEDVMFCERAAKLGYKTFVDHDASQGVQHIGTFAFGDSRPEEDRAAA